MKKFEMPNIKKVSFSQYENISNFDLDEDPIFKEVTESSIGEEWL